jgi:hypothetical protein
MILKLITMVDLLYHYHYHHLHLSNHFNLLFQWPHMHCHLNNLKIIKL